MRIKFTTTCASWCMDSGANWTVEQANEQAGANLREFHGVLETPKSTMHQLE